MKLICKNCIYWCWDFVLYLDGSDHPYDFSYSFCGLHGRSEIKNPDSPIIIDMLNGGVNSEFPAALCGFYPKKSLIPVQLSLF